METKSDGKRQTKNKRRDKRSQYENQSRSLGQASGEGKIAQYHSDKTHRSVCNGRVRENSANLATKRVTCDGGMLRQLIEEYRNLVQSRLAEIDRLSGRIEQLEELLN